MPGDIDMCPNPACRLVGEPTKARRCPVCGHLTARGTEATSEALKAKASVSSPCLVVTTNDVPGYRVERVFGDVFGLTVRARNAFSNLGASLRTVTGGEVGAYTSLLTESRNEARERLKQEALNLGANAVIAMRFDCNEIGGIMTEIVAYGTAVSLVSLSGDP